MGPFPFSAIVSEISHFFIFTEAATLSGNEAARATSTFVFPCTCTPRLSTTCSLNLVNQESSKKDLSYFIQVFDHRTALRFCS
jgi:hypothetical protein